jgi:dTDP-4-amino-4,6-dideoxygalactose transaminase
MDPILEIAKKHGLVVIEDAAQAHGAEYKGRKAGSIGDMGCFSFYPGKNLGAYGEGGMVTTSNPDYTRTIRMLRDWGAEKKYQHVLKGYNYRLEGVQGAILNVKLKYLEKWSNDRLSHAKLYNQLLAGSKVETPEIMAYGKPCSMCMPFAPPNVKI